MDTTNDLITIYTKVGYAKVSCLPDTTVKAMICTALRTVSINSPSQLYGLYWSPTLKEGTQPKHLLCQNLTWAELKTMYSPTELMLSICLYPTKFEEAARSDRSTLFYLYQQTKDMYYNKFKMIEDAEMAFELGCLEIRSFITTPGIEAKELLQRVQKIRPINSFFPPCVLQQNRGKSLRRSVLNQLLKTKHYSEEDCVLDMLNRYLMLLQFDREIIACWFGAGYGIPAELVIGPRYQVSIKIENAKQPRLLAYFASIRHVFVSKFLSPLGERFQVRLAIEPTPDPTVPLEMITFTFDTQESADTLVHLLDGYCGESVGAVLQGSGDLPLVNTNHVLREDFLPNGCPYRLREDAPAELQKLELQRESVVLEQVLGDGQFGDVYKGRYTRQLNAEPILVAVKTCKPESSQEDRRQFLEEARILGEFNHPHIVRLIGVCSSNPIWLVMEFAALGELRHYLLANPNAVSLPMKITFCYQIVTALSCLEERKCVHRDIAARNILVARKDWVKISDFGMAKILHDADEFEAEKGRKMPIKWMPPESIHERRFSLASDVWMFGVCMWEILSDGIKPFADITNAEAAELVTRGQRLKRPANCPPHLYIIMLECWSTNPTRRPRFSTLKPRLREIAAQTSNIENMDSLNEGTSIDEFSDQFCDGRTSLETPRSDTQASSTAEHSGTGARHHSRWKQVTQLEVSGTPTARSGTTPRSKKINEESSPNAHHNGHRSRRVASPLESPSSGASFSKTLFSPARSPTRVTFRRSGAKDDFNGGIATRPRPLTTPDFSRELSHLCEPMQGINLADAIQMEDGSSKGCPQSAFPQPASTKKFFVENSVAENGEACFAHDNNHYENRSPEDQIYTATVKVVQTVRYVSQQLAEAREEDYATLAKHIGVAVKELFLAVEDAFGTEPDKNDIFLAERQLNASMYHLVSTIRDANLSLNKGPLQEEFRRHLMSLSYVVANDAHSLYSAVHEYRMQTLNLRRTL